MTQLATIGGDRAATVRDMVERAKPKIASVLASNIDPERFVRVCVFNLTSSDRLMQCTPLSLLECIMAAAEFGLSLGGPMAECYPVPFKNEAKFIIGYRGLARLARDGGALSVEARLVRDGDDFCYSFGLVPELSHTPRQDQEGEITHTYAIVALPGGLKQFEVMTFAEVEAIRKRSRAGNDGPWATDWGEMAKKTVFRRLSKWIDLSPKAREAIDRSDQAEFGELSTFGELVTIAPPRSKSEAKRLESMSDAEAAQLGAALADTTPPEPSGAPAVFGAGAVVALHPGDETMIQGALMFPPTAKKSRTGKDLVEFVLADGGTGKRFSMFGSVPDGMVKGANVVFLCKCNESGGNIYFNASDLEVVR